MSQEMRIGFYTFSFFPIIGGAEVLLHGLAASLTERGHHVTLWAPTVRGKDNRLATRFRLCRYARPSSKRFGIRQTLPRLQVETGGRRPHVLHCHGAYPAGFMGATFKRLTATPLVIRPHGSDILPGEWNDRNPRLRERMRPALLSADAVVAQGNSLAERVRSPGVPAGWLPVGRPIRYSPNILSTGLACSEWAGSSLEPAPLYQSIGVSRWHTASDARGLVFRIRVISPSARSRPC
jgi:glycosyltransferase involved in cell wall biosynthesis